MTSHLETRSGILRQPARGRAGAGGERIRVAFCIDNMNVGGTELNAVRTAERLDRRRYEVRVVCLQAEGPLMSRYAAAGIPVHALPIPSLYGASSIRQGIRLVRLLREHRVDILHAHDVYSNVFGAFWARVAGVRVIESRRWWEGLPGWAWRLTSMGAYRFAHAVLANSPGVGELVRRQERVTESRIAVVPNFVDEEAFLASSPEELHRLREELSLSPTDRVVGIVANLLPIKDHRTLLRAFARLSARLPDVKLVLVGDGPERAPLEEAAGELGVRERVRFAGRRPNHPNPHQLFDVSVLCSTSEGLSNSILEAMAAGRPVVATRVGASADAVVDGVTGLLVTSRDPVGLADALETLLADPPRARRMGAAGRERAHEVFSASAALGALEELYAKLVGPAGRAPVRRKHLTTGRAQDV